LVDRTLEWKPLSKDEDLDVYRKPFLKSSAAGRSLMTTADSIAEVNGRDRIWFATMATADFNLGIKDPWLPLWQLQHQPCSRQK